MPEIRAPKKKKAKAEKPVTTDRSRVVSAYDEEGMNRNAADRRRDRHMKLVFLISFIVTLVLVAVTMALLFAFNVI